MEIAGVTVEDLAQAQALQNILKSAKTEMPVTECHAMSKTLVWFKDLCIALGRGYQVKPVVTPASASAPSTEGFKIKEFHPGTPPKTPKRRAKTETAAE